MPRRPRFRGRFFCALAAGLLLPFGLAAREYDAYRREAPAVFQIPEAPAAHEGDFSAYDLAGVRAGDWVEFDVLIASAAGEGGLLQMRIACVAESPETLWIEGDDVILARFWPGTSFLYEVDRGTRVVRRAWWGKPGEIPVEAAVGRVALARESDREVARRGQTEPQELRVADRTLACERVTYREGSPETGWGGETTAWMCADVPFPRRVSLSRADAEIVWNQAPTVRGGIVREIYRGRAVTTVTRLTAWGKDARARMVPPAGTR